MDNERPEDNGYTVPREWLEAPAWVSGNSTDGLYGPLDSQPWASRLRAMDAGLTDEQIAVMIAQRILAKSSHLQPTPEQSQRIWTRITQRLGWRR